MHSYTAPTPVVWDPQQYLRHSGHRTRPFLDLLARIPELPQSGRPARIADLGCGPGNVTALLAGRWPGARITGFDLSPEMLERARQDFGGPTPGGGSLDFRPADLAHWLPEEPYDLIVSSAALQWMPSHPDAFPAWIDALTPGGTFAFQVPGNFIAPSHALLATLCDAPRWRERLEGARLPVRPHPRPGRVPDPPRRPRLHGRHLGDDLLPAVARPRPGARLGQGDGAATRADRAGRRPGGRRGVPLPVPGTTARSLSGGPARHCLLFPTDLRHRAQGCLTLIAVDHVPQPRHPAQRDHPPVGAVSVRFVSAETVSPATAPA